MENFLKQLRLSDESITVYLKCIEKMPQNLFSFKELQAILPNTSPENLENIINELLSVGLLIHIPPKTPELITCFIATPPIAPVLNYYANINDNLPNIKNTVQEIVKNTLNQIIYTDIKIDLDPFLQKFLTIKKDISEDILIQKQDLQEVVKELDAFKGFKNIFEDFSKQTKSLIQTNFSDLLKMIPQIKNSLLEKVQALELKKGEAPVINAIEAVFKENTDEIVKEFTNSLTKSMEAKLNSLQDPLKDIFNKTDQTQNNFTMLYTNLLGNFEQKTNSFQDVLLKNKDFLSNNLKTLEKKLTEGLREIIQNTINQITGLNKPMEDILQNYSQTYLTAERTSFNNLWTINNKHKIIEEISNAIANSKQEIVFIVPKIEEYIPLDQLKNIPESVKIKIVTSDPSTNSLVKSLKEMKNIEVKELPNENIVAIRGDTTKLVLGIVDQRASDTLNNCIGFGLNYPILISILSPIIDTTWGSAQGEFVQARQPIEPTPIRPQIEPQIKTGPKPSIKAELAASLQTNPPFQQPISESFQPQQTPLEPAPAKKFESPAEFTLKPAKSAPSKAIKTPVSATQPIFTPNPIEPAPSPIKKVAPASEIPLTTKAVTPAPTPARAGESIIYQSNFQAKAGDEGGAQINDALNLLLLKLNTLKGKQFGAELQKIADIILESRGFSTTLHNIRSWINSYKVKTAMLTDQEKEQIFEAIEGWKQRLL